MRLSGSDVAFMQDALSDISAWSEQTVIIYNLSSVSYSGTDAEAGEPPTVAVGTRSTTARVDKLNGSMLAVNPGKFFADDRVFTFRGSVASTDKIGFSGTYTLVEGPYSYWIGSGLLWRTVGRKVQA